MVKITFDVKLLKRSCNRHETVTVVFVGELYSIMASKETTVF